MSEFVLSARGIEKGFREGGLSVQVLSGVDFSLSAGETVVIMGASGSGKSTLLHLLGGLDVPDRGEILLSGRSLGELSISERDRWRNLRLGFVYQFHHLLGEFTALENVMLPLLIARVAKSEARADALESLERVGLADRQAHKPAELSGGERQRVAIARALIGTPACVLADEPTGDLDEKTAQEVFKHMLALKAAAGTGLVIVTHDSKLADQADRAYLLTDRRLKAL